MTRHPVRLVLIRGGITTLIASGAYLAGGLMGVFPLELEEVSWNNIRIIAGLSILGCLMAAVGYGND